MALRMGLGVGPLPVLTVRNDPVLVQCFPPPEGAQTPVWVVATPDATKRPEVRRLTAYLA